jgi:protein TonB
MFDTVLNRANASPSRFGTGAILSVALHAGAVALILWVSTGEPAAKNPNDLAVKFMKLSNLPPPPPPPLAKLTSSTLKAQRIEHRFTRRMDTVVQPKEIPPKKPPEADPEPELENTRDPDQPSAGGVGAGVSVGVAGGVLEGMSGGVLGGVPGGQLGGQLGSGVLPFGEGMTRPEQTAGEPVRYTREALAAQVQGNMLVKCVITIHGRLENCRIIKALPHMEKAVLDALSTWRYKPVHYQGRPVPVDYLIQIKLVIPH